MKLFVLHGWTYTPRQTWAAVLEILQRRGVDVEALKIPGLSDGTDPLWSLDDYVTWLHEKTKGHDKVILWGHSNGGRISLAFAAKYPQRVAKLILEDSAGIPPSGVRKLKRDAFRIVAKAGGALTRSHTVRTLLYKAIRENDYKDATANMKQTMANLVAFDAREILQKIRVPTLILWGHDDRTTPRSAGLTLHEGIHDSKLVIIPGARHSPHITHPEVVADIAIEFIGA